MHQGHGQTVYTTFQEAEHGHLRTLKNHALLHYIWLYFYLALCYFAIKLILFDRNIGDEIIIMTISTTKKNKGRLPDQEYFQHKVILAPV